MLRALLGLYLVIGVLLLLIGFLFTGPCPERNESLADNGIFILTWPVSLYSKVMQGGMAAEDWAHAQTCGATTKTRV